MISLLLGCSKPAEHVVVFDAEPGENITVTTKTSSVTLDKSSTTADIESSGQVKVTANNPEALQTRYAQVLETVPEAVTTFILYFDTNKSEVNKEGRTTLTAILAEIQKRSIIDVQIIGHADQTGTTTLNDSLSMSRAETVRTLLQQNGITGSFIGVVGRGARDPIIDVPGKSEEKNRRVEVIIR